MILLKQEADAQVKLPAGDYIVGDPFALLGKEVKNWIFNNAANDGVYIARGVPAAIQTLDDYSMYICDVDDEEHMGDDRYGCVCDSFVLVVIPAECCVLPISYALEVGVLFRSKTPIYINRSNENKILEIKNDAGTLLCKLTAVDEDNYQDYQN
ncbi:MAG: hypothetical protein RR382_00545 [Tannerellaceae bacterium]